MHDRSEPLREREIPDWAIALVVVAGLVLVWLGLRACVGYVDSKRPRSELSLTKRRMYDALYATRKYLGDPDTDPAARCVTDLSALVPSHLDREQLQDEWGRPLRVSCNEDKVCVTSLGPNGVDEGGAGDDLRVCRWRFE